MKTRGRPRHPETLTPRQQEVLALLRQGLTNEEIAACLGITLDGAKFHVSEILLRLGVDSRYEAATWSPEAAPQPARGRWAFALAPLAMLHKLKWNAAGAIAASATALAAAAGIALLTWGLITVDHDDGSARLAAPAAIPTIGVAGIDRVMALLVAQDVDALTGLADFATIGCSTEQTVGSPPPCASGQPDGSPVPAFYVGYCEGTYVTARDQLRGVFAGTFASSSRSSIYAVLSDSSQDRQADSDWIAVTPGERSSATAPVSFWRVLTDGRISGLVHDCGPVGAAQQVAYRFPVDPQFVYGPANDCSDSASSSDFTANVMVTVVGASPGSVKPQFWGPEATTLGEPMGKQAIVTVSAATSWLGSVTRLEDVRSDMVLEAVGRVQPDCTILADTVLSPTR